MAAGDESPQPDRIYRCGICHLELVLSTDKSRMVVAPMDDDHEAPSPRHEIRARR
jgi:hypothetical protein